jgi:HEXXH motif-containing protein
MTGRASLYAPALPDDPLLEQFAARRAEGLSRLGRRALNHFPESDVSSAMAALTVFDALPSADRTAIVSHPSFSQWWLAFSNGYHSGDVASVRNRLVTLPRLVAIPALSAGSFPADGMRTRTDPDGVLRFPVHACGIAVPGVGDVPVSVRSVAQNVVISHAHGHVSVSLSDLAGPYPADAPILRWPKIPDTDIDVDSGRGSSLAFLYRLDDPLIPSDAGPLVPVALSSDQLSLIGEANRLLRHLWLPMARELGNHVRIIVPFENEHMASFTSTAWQGALFLRADLANIALVLERLVHEASHLRLNVIMASHRLHRHDAAETLPSPFRAGRRPVDGLIHGIFVFSRAARTLAAFAEATHDAGARSRASVLLENARAGLQLVSAEVRLTQIGALLVDEIESECQSLAELTGPD